MAGFTTLEMVDMLGLRLEDANEDKFSAALKLSALNWAQLRLTNLIHPAYLKELEVKQFDITCALDTNDDEGSITFSALTYQPLINGIQEVKIHDGNFAHMIEPGEVRKTVNAWHQGTNKRPLAYVRNERIYVAADDDIQHIDVWYLREPQSMVAQFTVTSVASGAVVSAPDLDAYYIELTFTTPGWTADEFNGQVGYNVTKGCYFIIVDNTTTVLKTVNPDETILFEADDVIHFVTADGVLDSLSDAACELNPSLHGFVVDLAESHLWRHDGKTERSKATYDEVVGEIGLRNARYESEGPPGIGPGRK